MEAKCEYLVEEGLTECPLLSIQRKKVEILRDWEAFIKSGFSYEKLTDTLYEYLKKCKNSKFSKKYLHINYFTSYHEMIDLLNNFDERMSITVKEEHQYSNIHKEMKNIVQRLREEIKKEIYKRKKIKDLKEVRETLIPYKDVVIMVVKKRNKEGIIKCKICGYKVEGVGEGWNKQQEEARMQEFKRIPIICKDCWTKEEKKILAQQEIQIRG